MMYPLLMGCSPDALRGKLADEHSPLAPWWRHLLTLAKQDPLWYSPYTVLAAVVTADEVYCDLARTAMLHFVEMREEAEISNEAQYHTHVFGAPLGRWAIFYDWLADLDLFTAEENAALKETFLDQALLFPMQHLQSRQRSFDNQIMANAFAAAAVGYVFGMKRGDDALGRRLFSSGVNWLHEILGYLPVGGYSPEGSTYHEQVVEPLTVQAARLLQETTGIDPFTTGIAPANLPVQKLLDTSYKMIGPAGLLPAWDAYGYQYATIKSGLTYLARLTGDPGPLAVIRDHRLWYRNAHPAWEMDDRLWTLVWWPEDVDFSAPATFPNWLIPEVAGSLQDAETKVRLYQYWDECGGVPSSGRSQVDPNNITLEAFQSPILMDGHGNPSKEVLPLPVEAIAGYIGERTIQTVQEYIFSAWGAEITREHAAEYAMNGSVGMANSLVFDDEGWYVPMLPVRGEGQALHTTGPLAVLRGDVTRYYTDRYDVSRVTRASALVGGRYVLVADRVTSTTPHALTWQAYLRPEAILDGARAVVRTPEQVRCDVIPLQEGGLTLTPVEGYPTHPAEKHSVLLKHTPPAFADGRIDVALVPQRCLTVLDDISDGWEREEGVSTDIVSLMDAYLSDDGDAQDTPRRFRRTLALDAGQDRLFIQVDMAGSGFQLFVNGTEITAKTTVSRGTWEGSVWPLPWFYDITDAVRDGENAIELRAPWFHGETVCGPVWLLKECPTDPVFAKRTGADTFRVTIGEAVDELVMEREDGVAPWAGGETDARYALLAADGTVAAAVVTRLALPSGLRFTSQAPCDLVWTPDALWLANLTGGSTLDLSWTEGQLFVDIGGCILISYRGKESYELRLALPEPRTVVINGEVLGLLGGPAEPEVTLDLANPDGELAVPTDTEAVYALAERFGEAAGPQLITALDGDDWRVQMAAAEVIGRLRIREAVPALLQRFAEGEAELPYPALKKWWRLSKMLRNPNAEEGPDPSLPLPISVKRWRVKLEVVNALGKIGDPRAVAPLEAALARCTDFFPVTSMLGVALGRLGSLTSIPVLERHLTHMEINTRVHARLALQLITGEIDRATFERKVTPG
jgi:hypothetical protein